MITPRKHEVEAVTEILDSEAFDGPDDMAKAVVKRVAHLLAERDGKEGVGMYLTVLEGCPFGPFYGAGDAERWAANAKTELGLEGRVIRLWAPNTYDTDDEAERAPLCTCGHQKERHVEKKKRDQVRYAECGVWFQSTKQWCACTTYQKEAGR
jgi:hypothetical protein